MTEGEKRIAEDLRNKAASEIGDIIKKHRNDLMQHCGVAGEEAVLMAELAAMHYLAAARSAVRSVYGGEIMEWFDASVRVILDPGEETGPAQYPCARRCG